jgi:hypothetical protein
MRAAALLVAALAAACTQVYDGEYVAEVSTTLSIEGAQQTLVTIETVEITVGDMASNELVLRRGACELRMLKRGGFGLHVVPGQTCTRQTPPESVWTLTRGGAPNERTDELVLELAWDLVTDDAAGTATEVLRIVP